MSGLHHFLTSSQACPYKFIENALHASKLTVLSPKEEGVKFTFNR